MLKPFKHKGHKEHEGKPFLLLLSFVFKVLLG